MVSSLKLSRWRRACITCLLSAALASASPAQTFQTVVNFDGADGNIVYAPLVQGLDGELYGTTLGGATRNFGTVFKITAAGSIKTLYRFCTLRNCADGSRPMAGLVLGSDGDFYGTTPGGGASGYGTIFKITPEGSLTTLHSFDGTDGSSPAAGLIQATDGNFYGTTEYGGSSNCCGTVYKISSDGVLTTLHNFDFSEAYQAYAALVEGPDGTFYGTAVQGGTDGGLGSAFKVTAQGDVTVLQSFCCTVGQFLYGGLVQAPGGTLYGTTYEGGAFGGGTIFKLSPEGNFVTLYNFAAQGDGGSDPADALVLGTDGNFYGASAYGAPNTGTVFRFTPSGVLTTLHDFNGFDGSTPIAPLMQATSGIFYGTTAYGGSSASCSGGCGTVFSIDVGLREFVKVLPSFGKVGTRVKILGTNLTGTTSVSFNGIPAAFTLNSPTLINVTIPAGATTGNVQVVTTHGTLTSNTVFRVR